ncbi:hypothetical protein Kfla_3243 [Kribbella flavida DSM 17836]|uniref:Uncharacterized protein n=1 Tax=Kribbella flavida (strain DSM 17836 / JCM 10339 / NBRC 14399) TaxID=479435 RepID=D2Q4J1_KRIFD|nr:DUF6507 family protein [Kribbella flavida]ADB32305.1 hypothetical protein Kfla_3243 [Kribbella flavida DSM 17836]
MVNWSVEAAAAMEGLKGLQTEAAGFEAIGTKLSNALTTAGTQASLNGKGGPIGIAISEFVEKWKDSLPGMVKHTGDVMQGTANALNALANGQQEMALAAQRGIQLAEGVDPRQAIRSAAAAARAEHQPPSTNRAV